MLHRSLSQAPSAAYRRRSRARLDASLRDSFQLLTSLVVVRATRPYVILPKTILESGYGVTYPPFAFAARSHRPDRRGHRRLGWRPSATA